MQISVLHCGFSMAHHMPGSPIRAPFPEGKCWIAQLHSQHQAFSERDPRCSAGQID